jgi:hypothetical protein
LTSKSIASSTTFCHGADDRKPATPFATAVSRRPASC